MYIENLKLENFRNYDSLNLDFSPTVNVIYGKNGYGKTNLLEAMFLCCIGKSFKTSHDAEMIQNDKERFSVRISVKENLCGSVSIQYDRQKRKMITLDGVSIEKIRFLFGQVVGILFSPETLNVINEGPSQRRKFVDIALCQISGDYYYNLYMYNKSCEEKNKLLMDYYHTPDPLTMQVLNESIASYGAKILGKRKLFLENIAKVSVKNYGFISGGEETLSVSYAPCVPSLTEELKKSGPVDEKVLHDGFLEDLCSDKIRQRESENRKCMIGPHRDDFDIEFNGFSIRNYGSQGQKRSAAVSLKIAELEIMRLATGKTPVLFLDDVLSELDDKRRKKIVEITENVQTFFTCTDVDAKDMEMFSSKSLKFINVEKLR